MSTVYASSIHHPLHNVHALNHLPQYQNVGPSTSTGGQQRSTRGASKQRRDQINVEIQKMRDLLPLSELIKDRLFQLQVMSLGCIFIRKHRYQQKNAFLPTCTPTPRGIDVCKALRGFMLMLTRTGKLLHVSDNASEYLGHSVEEIMCQGDSIYDLVDSRDHGAVQAELVSGPPQASNFPEERVFICRLNLARTAKRQIHYHKFVLIQGRYIQPAEVYQSDTDQPVFSAFCQPLINPENAESMSVGNTNIFSTQHYLDMKFKDADHMACHYLGHSRESIRGLSWYSFLHPQHVPEIAYKHRMLSQEKEGSVLSLIRIQSTNGQWIWVHSVFTVRSTNELKTDGKRVKHIIHCFHQKLSDLEAATLQANSWIYAMRHTYPAVPAACQESPPCSSDETAPSPTPDIRRQIKVEIPMRAAIGSSMFTPESSSPESSASLHLLQNPVNVTEILEEILPTQETLPELKDEVDEFLRQMEMNNIEKERQKDIQFPQNVNLTHRHSMIEPTTAAIYKHFSGTDVFDNNGEMRNAFPQQFPQNNSTYPQHQYNQHNFNANYYQRKRSWAV